MTGWPKCFTGEDKGKNYTPYFITIALVSMLIFPFLSREILLLIFAGAGVYGYITNSDRNITNLIVSVVLLLLISITANLYSYSLPKYIIVSAIQISTIGFTSATIVRCGAKKDLQENTTNLPSSLALLIAGGSSAFIAGSWYAYWTAAVSYELIFFIAVIGAITAALFESIPSSVDRLFSMTLGSAMAMWILAAFGYTVAPLHLLIAFIFALFLGYLAYRTTIADISAVLSATLMGVLIIVFSNILWFVLLLTFFILGGVFTKYKYNYKLDMGIAQEKGGVRTYENVFSNSTAALVLAIAYGIYPQHSNLITYAFLGTVATAAGDTLASEIGTTARQTPRMITNLKSTKTGTDGAVTSLGELAAFGGALAIGILGAAFGFVEHIIPAILITCAGGWGGTNIDSLLGATFQKNGYLSNSGVNFVATATGALISGILYILVL
ncbi:TIGR00297 family protein [Methanohalophilus sp. RSK]|uniref:DUF92 domain-containing protein n=1 Tax=Methanohalophilus sp. RSK TaxID=2485783 RepID=UPI0018F73AEA|nr:TIGR00297 family protein [Methanohalophilus sp. RSK]